MVWALGGGGHYVSVTNITQNSLRYVTLRSDPGITVRNNNPAESLPGQHRRERAEVADSGPDDRVLLIAS